MLFVADSASQSALQLVRIDGSELQTLYCYRPQGIAAARWSPDQKTVALQETTSAVKDINILTINLVSGALQPFFTAFMALDTWLDNSHFAVEKVMAGGDTGPETIYLVDATKPSVPVQNLQVIWSGNATCHNLIEAPNPNVLYMSQCALIDPQTRNRLPSDIVSIPVTGALPAGWPQQIIVDETRDITAMSPVGQHLLLYVADSSTDGGLWTVSTDGSKTVNRLITTNYMQTGEHVFLTPGSRSAWSDVSRDATTYAVNLNFGTYQTLVIGSVNGGNTTTVAQVDNNYDDSLNVAGWTTF